MLRIRLIAIASCMSLVLVAFGAGPTSAATLCDLLQNPEFWAAASSSTISALSLLCDGETPGNAPPVANDVAASAPGDDRLVNFRPTDVWPNITQSEPAVAVNNQTVLVGFVDSGQFKTTGGLTGYSRSTDGGATWRDLGAPTTPLGTIARLFGDSVVVADRARGILNPSSSGSAVPAIAEQRFYFANVATTVNTGIWGISVHRSLTGGLTWDQAANASPLATAADLQDKPWLAVDTRASGTGAGNVYVCWTRWNDVVAPVGLRFSRSVDGGTTFTEVLGSFSLNVKSSGCTMDVDPETGTVIVAWLDRNTSPPSIKVRRSTDFGTTFGVEVVAGDANLAETPDVDCRVNALRGGRDNVFLDTEANATERAIRSKPFPSVAFDPTSSNVYLVWHRAGLSEGSDADIALKRSTDNGATWNAPVRINSDVTGDQFIPSVATNNSGVVRVMYYSTQRSSSKRRIDTYDVASTNGGSTFSAPSRVTNADFDRPKTNPNFDQPNINPCYMGDYNDIVAPSPGLGGSTFYLTWGDNREDGNLAEPGTQPDPDVRLDTR